jgi:hypothetical protein
VATLATDATRVAVDASQVYWTTSTGCDGMSQVRSMAKGGGPVQTLADQQEDPNAIVVDQHDVYWYAGCGSNHLLRVPLGGGAVTDYAVQVQSNDGSVLATDGENLYFQDYGVVGVPIAGGPQFDVDDKDFVYGIAADHGGVYWIGPIGGTTPMGVFAYHAGAAGPTMLAMVGEVDQAIALDSGWIYFIDGGPESILRIPRSGGAIQTVVASGWASAMATDGTSLYWADGVPGYAPAKIHRTPVGGGADAVIAQADGYVRSMVIDADCLYFTDQGEKSALKTMAR